MTNTVDRWATQWLGTSTCTVEITYYFFIPQKLNYSRPLLSGGQGEIGSNTTVDTTIWGCSGPVYKMTWNNAYSWPSTSTDSQLWIEYTWFHGCETLGYRRSTVCWKKPTCNWTLAIQTHVVQGQLCTHNAILSQSYFPDKNSLSILKEIVRAREQPVVLNLREYSL